MSRIFVSQEQLDTWDAEGSAELQDDVLMWNGARYQLQPGVRFLHTIDNVHDPHDLVGKVKTAEQLASLSAEHYMNSVLLGDLGYEVQQGFVGNPV
jgi:hypothetical protein